MSFYNRTVTSMAITEALNSISYDDILIAAEYVDDERVPDQATQEAIMSLIIQETDYIIRKHFN